METSYEKAWSLYSFYEDVPPEHSTQIERTYKTFRRHPGRLLNVLYTFNLRHVPRGLVERIRCFDQISFNGLISFVAINKKE